MDDRYRLVPVDRDECLLGRNSKLPYRMIINEFANSDMDAVEVRFDDGINRDTVWAGLYSAARRSGAPVKVSMRRGKIYLVKNQED